MRDLWVIHTENAPTDSDAICLGLINDHLPTVGTLYRIRSRGRSADVYSLLGHENYLYFFSFLCLFCIWASAQNASAVCNRCDVNVKS